MKLKNNAINLHALYGLVLLMACSDEKVSQDIHQIELKAPYIFDVSEIKSEPLQYLKKLTGKNPKGDVIKVNNKYVEKNGKPWIPISGEFHFSRYPETHWEDAILKMKSSGLNTIASYIFWNHTEEIEGEFDWTGRNNLRKFVQLCAKHNMAFFARIGPWVHAEARYGGHPDWLVKKCTKQTLRSTHPDYIKPVERLYKEISIQLEGLYWKDGGPIYAIQLDNENWEHGEGKGLFLMEEEKRLALKYGMEVPIYTCTGWANAEFPQGEMIPSFGSYADYFWTLADTIYRGPSFSFSKIRPDGQIGTDMGLEQIYDDKYQNNPYFTCETGIGMNMAYHRRTQITPDDNAALSLVEIGNGCNSIGYFIFHGGRNPMGKLTRMNESIETGFNDNSVFSNDFQAAIGEFGQVRESFHNYPIQFGLLSDFGEKLAPLNPIIPDVHDEKPYDSKVLQRALRTDGKSGFLFVNNYAKNDTLYQFNNVQFEMKLKSETLLVPTKPVDVPKGSFFVWPLNLDLGGANLKYATAQPFAKIESNNTYFFFQNEGLDAEYVFNKKNIATIEGAGFQKKEKYNLITLKIENPGTSCIIKLALSDGTDLTIITLTEKQARRSYQYEDFLYISDAEIILFNKSNIEVISEKINNELLVYPNQSLTGLVSKSDGAFLKYSISFEKKEIQLSNKKINDGSNLKIPHRYHGENPRLGVPEDKYFEMGTVIELDLPKNLLADLYDVRLAVDYKASCGRFFVNDEFVIDNYYNGDKWVLSASHLFSDPDLKYKLALKFLPLHKSDPIYIGGNYWPDIAKSEFTLDVTEIKAVPVYKAVYNKD
ncbi:MAG: beta-galactosidase [Cyclobacteriaceae bacterium]